MNPFDRQTVYLRHPNGGVEDIDAAYAAGMRTFLLTLTDKITLSDGTVHAPFTYSAWRLVIERISKYPDAVYLPWAYLWDTAHIGALRSAAQVAYADQTRKLERPAACWNAESQLRDGKITLQQIIDGAEGCDVLISSEGWPYDSAPWEILPANYIVDAQLFPAENWVSTQPRDIRARWFERGVKCRVHFQHGIHDIDPLSGLPFPQAGRFSIYTMDDVAEVGGWDKVKPRTLDPLPKDVFPYEGPFTGPTDPKGRKVSKHPGVVKIKKALHRAGYGSFWVADDYWNKNAERAARYFQRDHGILATGQFGLGTYEALRREASVTPGEKYAVV